ncbi:MAG: hypothetical protein HUU48_01840 [Flavobacteriales bacterium]|nr:hypothetical protein [Flavobacteriales bacterium]
MKFCLFIFATLLAFTSFSQTKKEKGTYFLSVGASNFLGDLGGANQIGTNGLKDLELVLTRPAISGGYRYFLSNSNIIKGGLTYLRVNGDDKLTTEYFRNFRNLKFRSPILELSAIYEFYLLTESSGHLYKLKKAKGKKAQSWNIYVFGGIAGFWYNPKGPLNGRWYALRKFQTEGVRYSSINIAIPFGMGVKKTISRKIAFHFEINMRKTFTDYIDDVSTVYYDYNSMLAEKGPIAAYFSDPGGHGKSYQTATGLQRGDPKDKDAYMTIQFGISYKINRMRGIFQSKF